MFMKTLSISHPNIRLADIQDRCPQELVLHEHLVYIVEVDGADGVEEEGAEVEGVEAVPDGGDKESDKDGHVGADLHPRVDALFQPEVDGAVPLFDDAAQEDSDLGAIDVDHIHPIKLRLAYFSDLLIPVALSIPL
jgi:hypothetical protein